MSDEKRIRLWQCSCNYQTMVVDNADYNELVAQFDQLKAENRKWYEDYERLGKHSAEFEMIKGKLESEITALKAEVSTLKAIIRDTCSNADGVE